MKSPKMLITLEMANNHMGSAQHGEEIISEFSRFVGFSSRLELAFKLQYRHLESFIRPDFKNRSDLKHIKRFQETYITPAERKKLVETMKQYGFLTMATPFDERSVKDVVSDGIEIIKVASCSFSDWPLHEEISKQISSQPIILSCASASESLIDSVLSFYINRGKEVTLQHCIGEYPTAISDIELNQIDYLKARYPNVLIGFSTHEDPGNCFIGQMAVAKGAETLEKHLGVPTDLWPLNAYSCDPSQFGKWLGAVDEALEVCGHSSESRYQPNSIELDSLISLQRGIFAKNNLSAGDLLTEGDIFFAFPPDENQLTVASWSKYKSFTLKTAVQSGAPILADMVDTDDRRIKLLSIKNIVLDLLNVSGVITPKSFDLEISHHYGLTRFSEYGLSMITLVNREYCKKLLIVLPGQRHPEQYHENKEETFIILYGEVDLILDGRSSNQKVGDVVTIMPGMRHEFFSSSGAIIEEISSTHFKEDSFYTDMDISKNLNRKSVVKVTL